MDQTCFSYSTSNHNIKLILNFQKLKNPQTMFNFFKIYLYIKHLWIWYTSWWKLLFKSFSNILRVNSCCQYWNLAAVRHLCCVIIATNQWKTAANQYMKQISTKSLKCKLNDIRIVSFSIEIIIFCLYK